MVKAPPPMGEKLRYPSRWVNFSFVRWPCRCANAPSAATPCVLALSADFNVHATVGLQAGDQGLAGLGAYAITWLGDRVRATDAFGVDFGRRNASAFHQVGRNSVSTTGRQLLVVSRRTNAVSVSDDADHVIVHPTQVNGKFVELKSACRVDG